MVSWEVYSTHRQSSWGRDGWRVSGGRWQRWEPWWASSSGSSEHACCCLSALVTTSWQLSMLLRLSWSQCLGSTGPLCLVTSHWLRVSPVTTSPASAGVSDPAWEPETRSQVTRETSSQNTGIAHQTRNHSNWFEWWHEMKMMLEKAESYPDY